MTELKRLLLIAITAPFLAAGVVWQLIAGGFMAGRMLTSEWTGRLAREVIVARFGPTVLNRPAAPKDAKGPH